MSADVLIVEDDPDTRDALCLLLERKGYGVSGAREGTEALALLSRDGVPRLILLDLATPGMDGWTFLDVLRRRPEWSRLPVFVLTGDATLSPEDLVGLAADGLLLKPVEPDDLLAVVGRYSGTAQKRGE